MFKDALKDIVNNVVNPSKDTEYRDEINSLIDSDDFTKCVLAIYPPGKSPWDMAVGGDASDAMAVLNNNQPLNKTDISKTTTTSNKAQAILEGLVGNLPAGNEMVVVIVDGVHAMNLLPGDPSLAPLRQGNVAENVKTKLVEPSKNIANTSLPADKVNYLQNKAMKGFVGDFFGEDTASLKKAMAKPPVKKALKPANLKQHILDNVIGEKVNKIIEEKVDTKIAKFRSENSDADEFEIQDKREEIRTQVEKDTIDPLKAKVDAFLLQELDYPKFKIANTNWGSAVDQTFMVVAADPTTGKPTLWFQDGFSGQMTPAPEQFQNNKWEAMK